MLPAQLWLWQDPAEVAGRRVPGGAEALRLLLSDDVPDTAVQGHILLLWERGSLGSAACLPACFLLLRQP